MVGDACLILSVYQYIFETFIHIFVFKLDTYLFKRDVIHLDLPLNGDNSTMGSRSSLNRDLTGCENDSDYWEMNYHEAAIYLEVLQWM